jgi:hypothetical protein
MNWVLLSMSCMLLIEDIRKALAGIHEHLEQILKSETTRQFIKKNMTAFICQFRKD